MNNKKIQNIIQLSLRINQNSDNSYHYQYLCCLENGVKVNFEGLVVSEPTKIIVQLTGLASHNFIITECLIPCNQQTVTAKIHQENDNNIVTIIDRDNEPTPEDYNFVIVAMNRQNKEQIICDPQIRNKGKMY